MQISHCHNSEVYYKAYVTFGVIFIVLAIIPITYNILHTGITEVLGHKYSCICVFVTCVKTLSSMGIKHKPETGLNSSDLMEEKELKSAVKGHNLKCL